MPHVRKKALWATCLAALGLLAFAGSASAKLTGEFARFSQCPFTNLEVVKCLYSPAEGGEVVLGTKKVPIVKTAVIQGGWGIPNETTEFSKFYGATNGETLTKAQQPVPGGLLGVVPEEKQPLLVKKLIKFFFENKLTGLESTLELAKPASEIKISENHLIEEEGVAMVLPLKVHLENPFLGSKCYVGSSSSPITWELTTGKTSPPGPNGSIHGSAGEINLFEGGSVLRLDKAELVDNAWSAPAASGCGGILAFLVNPIVNASAGLPSSAGHNSAILKTTIYVGAAGAVRRNNEKNP